jgi:WD40 repeat protein/serine/threonine protein kinase
MGTSKQSGGAFKDWSPSKFSRIAELLDESHEMPASERAAWLADLERSDPKSAAVLRDMFAAQVSPSGAFLEEQVIFPHKLTSTPEADSALIGKQFGPYRVLSLLGYGGMGSVWLAERVDGLFTRQVALKLVHSALKGRVMTERFIREREILASLNHPNIARLLDAGFAEDGQPYLALDYVAGTPLTTYCDDRRLSIRERLELFRQVLNAVQYAHAHLVIHRDLKPANLLVTEEGQVQLLDFGIAKLLTEGAAKETELTQLGGRAMTPDYAAPEQIAGAPITTAADVYALGVMLYELLTGERPYKLKRESRGALEEAILQSDPGAPSRTALSEAAAAARATTAKKLSSTLRGDLETIVFKALKKSPTERYATANAFGEDIARFLRGDVVLAQPDSVAYRALKFARRHWVGIAAAGVLVLTLAGGLAATSYEARVASAERDAARQSQSRLLTEAAAQRLKDSDVAGAQGIILEVLTNPRFAQDRTPAAVSVFQEIRAAESQLAVLSGHRERLPSAAYSPDGTRIVTASADKTARIWDAHTGTQLAVLFGHRERLSSAAYSPDGSRIVTASIDKTARIWDAHTGTQLAVLLGHGDFVLSAAYSPDGTRIVTASADETARIWDAHSGKQLAVLLGHRGRVYSAAYSPDGTRIVTASYDKTARIWDARSGKQLAVFSGDTAFISAVYSPDGTRIVAALVDKTARIWDAFTGTQLAVLSGHRGAVNSAAYSPDGTRIVTASDDKTARIWDARNGTQLAVLSGHGDDVYHAAYSPDGTRIVTASVDKTARIWDARIPAGIDTLIIWAASAETDPLSEDNRRELGLPPDSRVKSWPAKKSACDQAAAAFYDSDRLASGATQPDINADLANSACAAEASKPGHAVRLDYQWGRALLAKHDVAGARRQFEFAVSKGYRAADIDLGNLLLDGTAPAVDPKRAVALYEKAWRDGLPIAAFALGHLYEAGVPGAGVKFQPDPAQAWAWFRQGASAGEPTALARLAERDEQNALAVQDPSKAHALLLRAFRFYAEAAERAHDEDWPDEAWRGWRYRRATLAHLLAGEGMMRQVADAYTEVREQMISHTPALWEEIKAKLRW